MDKKIKKKLAKQIASIVERAYRRGFQHGIHSDASEEDAAWFRHECRSGVDLETNFYSYSTFAPEKDFRYGLKGGANHTCLDRLNLELGNSESHAELVALLREAAD